jgi:hypothetical protein
MTGWRDLIKVHPAADAFPMMSPEDLDALAEDIRKNGLQNPVATWFDKNEQEWLIDGRNRLDALERLGYKFSLVSHNAAGVCTARKLKIRNPNVRKKDVGGHDCTALDCEWAAVHQFRETHTCGTFGWPIADPYDLARLYNLDRRHLSKDGQKDAAAQLLRLQPERSDRSIARDTGLDHKTVAAERKKGEASGDIPHIEPPERTDAGGRKRARKTPTPKKPATTDFDPTTPAEPVTPPADVAEAIEKTPIAAVDHLGALQAAWDAAPEEVQSEFLSWVHEAEAVIEPAAPEAVSEPEPPGDRVQRLVMKFGALTGARQTWICKHLGEAENAIKELAGNTTWTDAADWLTSFIALSDDERTAVCSQLEEKAA